MERLTNSIDYCQLHCDFGKQNECFFQDKSKCYEKNIYEKLREYENLEEQGLLLRLPCKVGTKVYAINPIIDYGEVGDESIYYYSIIEREFQIYMMMDYGKLVFGRNVFLTKAEAEQKLKEMESD
ncbi:MAG: hypothetical protein SPJ08_02610 [Sphaerochaetaceae bacterium]|nr:hypothetical protein [Sphaerochaetaceae bacterium]